jgi:hypothetical protein
MQCLGRAWSLTAGSVKDFLDPAISDTLPLQTEFEMIHLRHFALRSAMHDMFAISTNGRHRVR